LVFKKKFDRAFSVGVRWLWISVTVVAIYLSCDCVAYFSWLWIENNPCSTGRLSLDRNGSSRSALPRPAGFKAKTAYLWTISKSHGASHQLQATLPGQSLESFNCQTASLWHQTTQSVHARFKQTIRSGPIVALPCRQGFDFTLLFEQSILSIGPSCVFLLILPLRLFSLYRSKVKPVVPGHSLYRRKAVGHSRGQFYCSSTNQILTSHHLKIC